MLNIENSKNLSACILVESLCRKGKNEYKMLISASNTYTDSSVCSAFNNRCISRIEKTEKAKVEKTKSVTISSGVYSSEYALYAKRIVVGVYRFFIYNQLPYVW